MKNRRKMVNRKFSITVDEWTDVCTTRYLNVTAHVLKTEGKEFVFDTFVLGLVEITGKADAVKIKNLVENKLSEFNIDIKNDVIASTHDGASIMNKYGNELGVLNQLCQNHALHLAVIKSFFQKTNDFDNVEDDADDGVYIDGDIDEVEETSFSQDSVAVTMIWIFRRTNFFHLMRIITRF